MFLLAKRFNKPSIYIGWARLIVSAYHGLAYHKGKYVEMKK